MLLTAVVIAIVHGHCSGCVDSYRLDRMQFVSRAEGWATAYAVHVSSGHVSQYGTVLHTTDGGKHWRPLPGVDTYGVEVEPAFCFVDAKNGWVTWPTTTEPLDHLLRTRDGGRSWQELPGSGYLVHLQFFNEHFGVAAESTIDGPVFHASADGGSTWSNQRLDLDFPSLFQFVNPKVGFIAGNQRHHSDFLPRVLRTTDGGEHWQLSSMPANVRGTPRDMFFADAANGWLILWNGGAGNRNQLLRTADGGANWQVVPGPSPEMDAVRDGFVFGGKKAVRDGEQIRLPATVESCTTVGDEIWCSSGMDLLKITPSIRARH